MATTTRFLGFCPCCEGTFKVRDDNLVHHGYQRPGWGYIVGDCYGACKTPHELSPETAKGYLELVTKYLAETKKSLAALPSKTELRVTTHKGETKTIEKTERPAGGFDWDNDRKGSLALLQKCEEWERAYASREYELRSQERGLTRDVARMTAHVETWEAKELTTVEEESIQAAKLKAARETKKREAREAKMAKAVASFQKRIDSAVRNRNSGTLADIWESVQRKLRDIDPSLSKADALAMVERDEVWEAFGLKGMTLSNWKDTDKPEKEALRRMKDRMDRVKGHHINWAGDDDWTLRMLKSLTLEWPAELGGENKKGARTLVEVREMLEKLS